MNHPDGEIHINPLLLAVRPNGLGKIQMSGDVLTLFKLLIK
jgi:hypothetical protein